MTDNSIPGPMCMVKIDGSKIKHLREEQGLTQLYLATAVQVTTDTISRWENKRYPSIKKENGIKLAEALNVDLEALLQEIEATDQDPLTIPAVNSTPTDGRRTKNRIKRIWLLPIISLTLLCFVAAIIWYSLYLSPELTLTAERIAPEHCIAGQPFPVMIRISGIPEDKPTSIIVRENLPAYTTVLKVSPEVAGGGMKKDMIKWLKKINTTATFTYVISINGEEDDKVLFKGTAAIGGESDLLPPIIGSSTTSISMYHWADTDKDNIISDSEILAVIDRYNDIEGIDIDIDTLEEIWLGSGYKWNKTTKTLEIFE